MGLVYSEGMSSTHRIPTAPTADQREGHFNAYADIAFAGGRRHYFAGWTADGAGRLEHGGPMVAGPHAFAGPAARVIARVRVAERPLVQVEPGDLLVTDHGTYRVERDECSRFLRGDCEMRLVAV